MKSKILRRLGDAKQGHSSLAAMTILLRLGKSHLSAMVGAYRGDTGGSALHGIKLSYKMYPSAHKGRGRVAYFFRGVWLKRHWI